MEVAGGLVEAFGRDGFAVCDQVLTPEAVERLAQIIGAHRAANDGAEGYGTVDSGVSRDLFVEPAMADWLDDNALASLAARLLGADAVEPVRDRLFVKAPNGGARTQWHQDGPLTKEAGPALVVLWVPVAFDGVDAAPLQVVPGSQRGERVIEKGLAAYRSLTGPDTAVLEASEIHARYDVVTVDVRLGDVVALDGLVLHASLPNDSPVERLAYSVRFIPVHGGRPA